jgi:hypothetical protein
MTNASSEDEKADLDAKVEKFRQRTAAREAEIKAELMKWLGPRDNVPDSVSMTRVLMDLAFDRHVGTHDAAGFDLIESAYKRALKRAVKTVQ